MILVFIRTLVVILCIEGSSHITSVIHSGMLDSTWRPSQRFGSLSHGVQKASLIPARDCAEDVRVPSSAGWRR